MADFLRDTLVIRKALGSISLLLFSTPVAKRLQSFLTTGGSTRSSLKEKRTSSNNAPSPRRNGIDMIRRLVLVANQFAKTLISASNVIYIEKRLTSHLTDLRKIGPAVDETSVAEHDTPDEYRRSDAESVSPIFFSKI
ncbi:hypothetical protein X797_001268 [Metarhizium robertsii]|uniref:Uncharacterized protein n=1 Tax=Metarhizium robertsii TaxID=568076 RepID=A0A0A1V9Z5_9HYPO|nr:hypothetical protein X797_001268 [Metarhizium robertsii]